MSTLRNSVHLIGNLGMDPEVKELNKNKRMVRFSLATSEAYKNAKGEKITNTQWHNIVAWGKTAQIAADYLQKGRSVALSGKLTHRTYEDKEGVKKYISEIVANELVLLNDSKK